MPSPLETSVSSPFKTPQGFPGIAGMPGRPQAVPGRPTGQRVVVNYGPESFVFNVERELTPREVGLKALAYLASHSQNKEVADLAERIEDVV